MSGGRTLTDSNSIVWSILVADQVAALRTALTGDVTAAQDSSATTISANAVTNAKLATMDASTFKMRAAGTGTGDPIDGTAAQAKAALAIDHGADLAGLTDDDHTQYALLAGRAGGQTLVGGTAAGDDLLLSSTANATKGTIRLGSATTGLFFDEVNSRLTLGGSGENTVTINGTTFGEAFVVHATADVEIGAHRHTATAGFGASLYGVRSRGTEGAETAVQNNDTVLFLSAAAHDGTDYAFCGQILFEIDGTPGNNDMPGRIIFKTTADGASTTTEALRLSSDQSATFAGVVTMTNTGLHLLDTNASHDLIIKPGSNITADRTLTLTTGDTDITVDLTDAGSDKLLFWDESASAWTALTLAGGLEISGTTIRALESFVIACSDETTVITATTNKVKFRMPYAFTVTAVRASLSTTQASGNIFTVDINETGTSILSTKLTIDNTETTSTTAATPAVISDTALADDAEISIDVDQIGDSTAKGLKVVIIGYRP